MTNNATHRPVTLYGFLTPKPGSADTLRALLLSLVEPSRTHQGSLQYHLHEQEDGRFFLYEVWHSREDLDRHNATPLLQDVLARIADHLASPPESYFADMRSPLPA
ncbi:putative quinol monooxygenase [Actinocorallia aurea]